MPQNTADSQPPAPPPASQPTQPPDAREVRDAPWWVWLALFPVAVFVRLWLATLRIRFDPAEMARWKSEAGNGRLVLFWHNRLVVSPELRRRFASGRVFNGLVSASRDGAWLSVFFRHLGVNPVRGSSSWRGAAAMLEIKRRLAQGEDTAITPDGPRGPCYHWQRGGVCLVLRTGHPIFLVGLKFHRARRLASWDGFYLPAPFSRVDMRMDCLAPGDPLRASLSEDALAENLHHRLDAITNDSGFPWTPRPRKRKTPAPATPPSDEKAPLTPPGDIP